MTTDLSQVVHINTVNDNLVSADVLGGKGYNLVRLRKLAGLNVPDAVIVTTNLHQQVMAGEHVDYKALATCAMGQLNLPSSLMSVRSGAKFSMPGMMDTILNVGIFDTERRKAALKLGGLDFVLDCTLRFTEMFLDVAMGFTKEQVATVKLGCLEYLKQGEAKYKDPKKGMLFALDCISDMVGEQAQLYMPDTVAVVAKCMEAVHGSWMNERAILYRQMNSIPDDLGTAIVVQRMVFGNLNEKSCTGVMFSSDPATGVSEVTGEYLRKAQGEDVVAGTHTPDPLSKLNEEDPALYEQLLAGADHLEDLFRDMQDMEFTVENGVLYWLQTRNAKRTPRANVIFNTNWLSWNFITLDQYLARVSYNDVASLLEDTLHSPPPPDHVGIGASAGVIAGVAVASLFEAQTARIKLPKVPLILVAEETTPEDLPAMALCDAILTRRGGFTSHAAVVARSLGKVCVVGCAELPTLPDLANLTVQGSTGKVWRSLLHVVKGSPKEVEGIAEKIASKIARTVVGRKSAAVYLSQDHQNWAGQLEQALNGPAEWVRPILPTRLMAPAIFSLMGNNKRQHALLVQTVIGLDAVVTKPCRVVLEGEDFVEVMANTTGGQSLKKLVVWRDTSPANLTINELANHLQLKEGAPFVSRGAGTLIPVKRSILSMMEKLGIEYHHEQAVPHLDGALPPQSPSRPVLHLSAAMLLRSLWP